MNSYDESRSGTDRANGRSDASVREELQQCTNAMLAHSSQLGMDITELRRICRDNRVGIPPELERALKAIENAHWELVKLS